MKWSPPPITAVRAFAVAARMLSFSKAADELHVTQSAISHGIRQLEARLNAPLFIRERGRLSLSHTGKAYLPFAREALERLRAGEAALLDLERNPRVLTVSVSPSFAAKWLVPRLGAFAEEHPELDLRISATIQHVDLEDRQVDLAVRHGDGQWPELHAVRLCSETMFPVCHPALLGSRRLRDLNELGQFVLLHHKDRSVWTQWFSSFGLDPPPAVSSGPALNEMSLVIDAAVSGQGIALARSALAAGDLAGGRLVRPLKEEAPAIFSYWVVCLPSMAQLPKIIAFRDWLLREAKGAAEALGRARSEPDRL